MAGSLPPYITLSIILASYGWSDEVLLCASIGFALCVEGIIYLSQRYLRATGHSQRVIYKFAPVHTLWNYTEPMSPRSPCKSQH